MQIGVLPNPNVPDLVRALLPAQHSALSARFLRRWLQSPPPYVLATRMADLCRRLGSMSCALGPPPCRPMPVGKLVSMLSLRQGNAPLFRDLHGCLTALLAVLDAPEGSLGGCVPSLLAIVAFESGIDMGRDVLRERAQAAVGAIEELVSPQGTAWGQGQAQAQDDAPSSDEEGKVPQVREAHALSVVVLCTPPCAR
jgi:hypothetical protein